MGCSCECAGCTEQTKSVRCRLDGGKHTTEIGGVCVCEESRDGHLHMGVNNIGFDPLQTTKDSFNRLS